MDKIKREAYRKVFALGSAAFIAQRTIAKALNPNTITRISEQEQWFNVGLSEIEKDTPDMQLVELCIMKLESLAKLNITNG